MDTAFKGENVCGGGGMVKREGIAAIYLGECVLSPGDEHYLFIRGLHTFCENCNAYNDSIRVDKQRYYCSANKHFSVDVR